MYVLCIAPTEVIRTRGLSFAKEKALVVLLNGTEPDPAIGGSPGFLLRIEIVQENRGMMLIELTHIGLKVEVLTEER